MSMLTENVSPQVKQFISFITLLFFLPFLVYAVFLTVNLYNQASGTKAAIVVDASKIAGPIDTDFYHAFAQGGEEAADMIGPVVGEVRSLTPRVIRVDHIYDYYQVVGRSANTLTFDFSRLDQVVNSILATGATPVLSLSYMPPAIAKDGSVINPPNDWNEWALVVQKTIEQYSGRSNKNLRSVYYEVWNEPDLAQFGSWRYQGQKDCNPDCEKNYTRLYRYAAIGARNATNVNTFSFGGPSTTGYYSSWIKAILGSGMRVDFVSWHTYGSDPTKFAKDQNDFTTLLLSNNYRVVPSLITEFGFNGGKDTRYGTTYAASYTAAVIRQLMDNRPKYAFSFQLKDGPNQTDGSGWGILTHETSGKRKKPRFSVYTFLDQMAGNRVQVTGEGTWVTSYATQNDKTLRVMLINFDQYGNKTETTPVTIANIVPGTYAVRLKYLFQNGCGIDNPPAKNPPALESFTEGTYIRDICMPPQNVAILELTRQNQ